MKHYLLSVYQSAGDPPPPEVLDPIMRDVDAVNDEMRAAGAWVFAGGLHPPTTATVLRSRGSEVLTMDGPFAEGEELLGGIAVIRAAELDEALRCGRKLARATTLPIEVRPFHDEPGS